MVLGSSRGVGAVALEKLLPSDIATQPGLSLISSSSGPGRAQGAGTVDEQRLWSWVLMGGTELEPGVRPLGPQSCPGPTLLNSSRVASGPLDL